MIDKLQALPSPEDLLLKVPLYASHTLTKPTQMELQDRRLEKIARAHEDDISGGNAIALRGSPPQPPPTPTPEDSPHLVQERLKVLMVQPAHLDAYCMGCEADSVFVPADNGTEVFRLSYLVRRLRCVRGPADWADRRATAHHLFFCFYVDQEARTITKVGQRPSLADIAEGTISTYRKALEGELYAEFKRGVGLAAHGVGVGSFVYLRRVFERLLDEAHQNAVATEGWDESGFPKRIEDRILALRAFLPAFLVETRALYAILSKGIHELDEQECLQHFELVRSGIELILDERLTSQARDSKIVEAKKSITTLSGQLSREGNKMTFKISDDSAPE
jgi:hypothetical protein